MDFVNSLAGKPVISVVTLTELFAGVKSRKEETLIGNIERILQVLPVTSSIAKAAGQHLKHYRGSHGLDDLDAIIAATAEHHDLALATLNVKHFPMFARLKPAY